MEDRPNSYYAKSRKDWRKWLEKNHLATDTIWLIIYKKETGVPTVYYDEAVEEALCYGWIDSKPNKRDDSSYYQFFSKRNPRSNWSAVNKSRVEKLMAKGLIAEAGMQMIELAKKKGTWDALNDVDNLVMPYDLDGELNKNTVAKTNFEAFPKSVKRGILEWILNAKRPETRQKRIDETVTLAAKNIRANQYNAK